jgi:hypothetical protein
VEESGESAGGRLGLEGKRWESGQRGNLRTTVVDRPGQVNADAPETTPANPEELLGRVLDDDTVAALAEQARGMAWRCWAPAGLHTRPLGCSGAQSAVRKVPAMTRQPDRADVLATFAKLASLVEPEGYEANRWIRELRTAQRVLADRDISDAEAIAEVRELYWSLYHGGRNFADFFLWREDEMERRLANEEFAGAKQAIEELLGT